MEKPQRDGAIAHGESELAAQDFWEQRYADAGRLWSGGVNAVLADIAPTLMARSEHTHPHSLDLGCGEGGDALWLAQKGWIATGVDISTTAIERARSAVRSLAISEETATFVVADLSEFAASEQFDLVTANFLQSPVELARSVILRAATELVAPRGHLLITSHASPPRGNNHGHSEEHTFPTPQEELRTLDLDSSGWEVVLCEIREREVRNHNGDAGTTSDAVVLVRRR